MSGAVGPGPAGSRLPFGHVKFVLLYHPTVYVQNIRSHYIYIYIYIMISDIYHHLIYLVHM